MGGKYSGSGGGISASGTINISNSTITNNSARLGRMSLSIVPRLSGELLNK